MPDQIHEGNHKGGFVLTDKEKGLAAEELSGVSALGSLIAWELVDAGIVERGSVKGVAKVADKALASFGSKTLEHERSHGQLARIARHIALHHPDRIEEEVDDAAIDLMTTQPAPAINAEDLRRSVKRLRQEVTELGRLAAVGQVLESPPPSPEATVAMKQRLSDRITELEGVSIRAVDAVRNMASASAPQGNAQELVAEMQKKFAALVPLKGEDDD